MSRVEDREPVGLYGRLACEGLGALFLLAIVVGSGIMAERLSGRNVAIALLANALATGTGLIALILATDAISGAHFNPVVTPLHACLGKSPWREAPAYIGAQIVGGFAGVLLAHAMFNAPLLQVSTHARTGTGQWVSEAVATFDLLASIWGCARSRPDAVPFAVGAYITSAYWFTASTSFANPAVTLARSVADTFAGTRPQDAPAFLVAQLVATAIAVVLFRKRVGARSSTRVPHTPGSAEEVA